MHVSSLCQRRVLVPAKYHLCTSALNLTFFQCLSRKLPDPSRTTSSAECFSMLKLGLPDFILFFACKDLCHLTQGIALLSGSMLQCGGRFQATALSDTPDFCDHVTSVSSFYTATPIGFRGLFSGLAASVLLIANVIFCYIKEDVFHGYGPPSTLLNMQRVCTYKAKTHNMQSYRCNLKKGK